MVPPSLLFDRFLAHLPPGAPPPSRGALETALAEYVDAARRAWPELQLDDDRFLGHLARHTRDGALPLLVYAADVYLACACAHGVDGAITAFDRAYGPVIRAAIGRKDSAPAFVDETEQELRERLFVAAEGLPKIAEYGGRAALKTWVTIAGTRTALMARRGAGRRRESPEVEDDLPDGTVPELAFLKRRYAGEFSAALAHAFSELPDEDRTLLRLHLVDRLGIDKLALLHKVGRSTAARWLVAVRAALVDSTRNVLRARLGLTDSEYESLAVLVRSQLDVSVLELLRGRER